MATHCSVHDGESQGRGSLVGCRLWGRTESDTTEATQQQQQHCPYQCGLGESARLTFLQNTYSLQGTFIITFSHLWYLRLGIMTP